jgi:hypothetical protein
MLELARCDLLIGEIYVNACRSDFWVEAFFPDQHSCTAEAGGLFFRPVNGLALEVDSQFVWVKLIT